MMEKTMSLITAVAFADGITTCYGYCKYRRAHDVARGLVGNTDQDVLADFLG